MDELLILVVGEDRWPKQKGVLTFNFKTLDKSGVRASSNILQVHDTDGNWRTVSGVIWRHQFDESFKHEHAFLEMILLANVPCLNRAECMRQNGSRISTYATLIRSGMPVVPSEWFLGAAGYGYFYKPAYPVVLKVGDWHMGYGKMKVPCQEVWLDAVDMAAITHEHISIEPFVEYIREMRCLLVGNSISGTEREGSQWKTNICPKSIKDVEVPHDIEEMTRRAAKTIGADIIGIDWLQMQDGSWVILEANLAPGLNYPWKDWRVETVQILKEMMKERKS